MTNRGDLKKALDEWLVWVNKFAQVLIPRKTSIQLYEGLALALTGVRHSGKTSTAIQLVKELGLLDTTFYFNFEDPVFFSGADVTVIDTLISLYQEKTGHDPILVVLDEIQYVEGWEKWVRKTIDTERYRVIVTGSSSNLLSSEIATAISGRVIEQTIYPLSFNEYLSFQNCYPSSEGVFLKELDAYLKWGGFPKVTLMKSESEKTMLLKQYLSDIVLRDVISRHKIINQHALRQIVTWYLTGVSCPHSYTSIRKAFGISIELISNFTHYLSQAFLVFEMQRFHPNLKVQTRDSKKIYIIDPGLRSVSLQSDRKDYGRLAENLVYLELRRRNKQLFYYQETQEVDFIVAELGKPQEAIQVSYSNLEEKKTLEREISALLECLITLNLEKGTILTLAFEDIQKINGREIHFIPLYKWLIRST